MTLTGGDRLIGRIGHWYAEGWPELEVGWALDPTVWGRGLAVERARACLELARNCLGLSSVISLIDPSNHNSQRVAEKLAADPTAALPSTAGRSTSGAPSRADRLPVQPDNASEETVLRR